MSTNITILIPIIIVKSDPGTKLWTSSAGIINMIKVMINTLNHFDITSTIPIDQSILKDISQKLACKYSDTL